MKLRYLLCFLYSSFLFGQNIGDFQSVVPTSQTTEFIFPSSHTFQKIIAQGDPLSAGGVLMGNTDFTGYVPINGSSTNGFLSINAETLPGGVSVLDINYNNTTKLWDTTLSQAIDFTAVVGTAANCSGTVTPWNTIISCEEYTSKELVTNGIITDLDMNNDGYDDLGWAVEIDPSTKMVIDKRWALGNFKHENLAIHPNERTAYQGTDNFTGFGFLYKFVADVAQDLSSGKLYVYKGPKDGNGDWILLNNTTKEERNSTKEQSTAAGATNFEGIEDVEIGPNGSIYFAVKNEDRVYRFQDSDAINGITVTNMETYVGNASYSIAHANGSTLLIGDMVMII